MSSHLIPSHLTSHLSSFSLSHLSPLPLICLISVISLSSLCHLSVISLSSLSSLFVLCFDTRGSEMSDKGRSTKHIEGACGCGRHTSCLREDTIKWHPRSAGRCQAHGASWLGSPTDIVYLATSVRTRRPTSCPSPPERTSPCTS